MLRGEVGEGKVKKFFGRRGLERIEKDTAGAGKILSIAGYQVSEQRRGWSEYCLDSS